MIPNTKYRVLIWIIVILIATNLSTIGSFYYHQPKEVKVAENQPDDQQAVPGEQRTRFFREQLDLNDEQLDQFRDINRTFNRKARMIEMNLARLRQELINELGTQNPDTARLDRMAGEIGNNHSELKHLTVDFYLSMKRICTGEQQAKLHLIFQSMLNKDNQINLPKPGFSGGRRHGR